MKYVILILLLLIPVTNAHSFCFALLPESPCIDAGTRDISDLTTSYNGIPRVGKYPGDEPDIGAWEWFPGVTCENPTGEWTGVPLDYNPREVIFVPPKNLRVE